ncbi:MAG: LysR family transcriptional regulator [Pseudomonadales bacterium]
MEMRQIRYFVAVAEEGNFSAASLKLYVSQPPITRQIQQLELELGVELFTRHRKGVTLTPAGEAFLEEARQILIRSRMAKERSRAAAQGEIGSLEVAYFGSPIYFIIPQLVRQFRARNPSVNISLQPLSKDAQIAAVKDGRIHVGFGRFFPRDDAVAQRVVAEEKLLVALPEGHAMQGRRSISPSALSHETLILFPKVGRPSFADEVLRVLTQRKFELQQALETADLSSAMALTAAGMGVCPVPDSVSKLNWPNIRFVRLQGVTALAAVNCIHTTHNQSPILQKFLATLGDTQVV